MSSIREVLPTSPMEGPPVPRHWGFRWPWLQEKTKAQEEPAVAVKYGACEYGISCIRDHMLRAHLFMMEALRFSAAGKITPDAQGKIRLAREQLLCEDDFQASMDSPTAIKAQMLRLLAATRSTWKAIDSSGIDRGFGSADDINEVARAIKDLSDNAYQIDTEFHRLKLKEGE